MKFRTAAALVVTTLVAAAGCADTATEPESEAALSPATSQARASTESTYIVSADRNLFDAVVSSIEDAGGTIVRSHPRAGIVIAGDLSSASARRLARASGVKAMAPNVMIERPDLSPEAVSMPSAHDPTEAFFFQLGYQWDMEIIDADDAWNAGASAEGVTVAILDTGIDATHPDLAGLVDASRSIAFVPNENPAIPAWGDDHFHGTHVAGTVASNGLGTAGVAPHATLMAVKICGAFFGCPFDAIVSGIIFAAENGADVINMSLTGYIGAAGGGGQINALLGTVMNYASRMGVVAVSAAGNDGYDLQHLGRDWRAGSFLATPCESGNGMCVSATNYMDEPTGYTNYGKRAISVAAPGGDTGVPYLVLAPCSTQSVYLPVAAGFTCDGDDYLWLAGTSMASPHVAGAAALVMAQGASPGQVKTILQRTADDLGKEGADPFYGKGRLNVMNAWSN